MLCKVISFINSSLQKFYPFLPNTLQFKISSCLYQLKKLQYKHIMQVLWRLNMKNIIKIFIVILAALALPLLYSTNINAVGFESKASTFIENPIIFEQKSVKLNTGAKKEVKIITVTPNDSRIRFEVGLPSTMLNKTRAFDQQIKEKKPFAAINGNFFEAYGKIKDPAGHVFINGKLIYGQSGMTSVGITYDKKIIFGKPATFVTGGTEGMDKNIRNSDGSWTYYKWTAYEVNTRSQSKNNVIMYTPERGESVEITKDGYIAIINDNIVSDRFHAKSLTTVKIPKNGYVVYFGEEEADTLHGYDALQLGRKVHYKYTLFKTPNETFPWEKMQWAISGGPDLVIDGEVALATKSKAFSGERFTTMSTSRMALGLTKDGRLLLVSVSSATIEESKEIMKSIGAFQAINLDGGGSTAMYYDGKLIIKPGRELTTMLYIYKN